MSITPQQNQADDAADGVRLGLATVNEEKCIAELAELNSAIEFWAKENELWDGSALLTPFVYKADAPKRYEALLLSLDGSLLEVFHGYHKDFIKHDTDFRSILKKYGFNCEMEDATTIRIKPLDEKQADEYLALYRWRWIQNLATRRLYDIHEEVFEHFAKYPNHLVRLEWRQYEEFLDSVFRNQGFRTELGQGTNDGGVDIRLYQSQSIPQMVTLVQAKRYTTKPIGLETVAALFGISVQQRAHKGILATTSRFQPVAKQFARSVSSGLGFPNIELVDSRRVVADFPYEVILQPIGSEQVSGDGMRGTEVAKDTGKPHPRFIAFKGTSTNERLNFWGDGELYFLWDGTPQCFDYLD